MPVWTSVWRHKGPLRGPLLLWLVAQNRLKTKTMLWQRQCVDSPICEVCGNDSESSIHVMRDYIRATRIWQYIVLVNLWENFWNEEDIEWWVQWNLSRDDNVREWLVSWRYKTLQTLWRERTGFLFQQKIHTPVLVTLKNVLLESYTFIKNGCLS